MVERSYYLNFEFINKKKDFTQEKDYKYIL